MRSCNTQKKTFWYTFADKNMYLLTEWKGRTGKYLARGQGVRTERSEVRTSYDHLLLKILKILFEPK